MILVALGWLIVGSRTNGASSKTISHDIIINKTKPSKPVIDPTKPIVDPSKPVIDPTEPEPIVVDPPEHIVVDPMDPPVIEPPPVETLPEPIPIIDTTPDPIEISTKPLKPTLPYPLTPPELSKSEHRSKKIKNKKSYHEK